MNIQSGTIASVEKQQEWSSNRGVFQKWQVFLKTGEMWYFNTVKGNDFRYGVGETITFQVKNEQHRNASLVQQQQTNYQPQQTYNAGAEKSQEKPSKDLIIMRQSMLKAAVDYHGNNHMGDFATEEDVINTARKFVNFINNG